MRYHTETIDVHAELCELLSSTPLKLENILVRMGEKYPSIPLGAIVENLIALREDGLIVEKDQIFSLNTEE